MCKSKLNFSACGLDFVFFGGNGFAATVVEGVSSFKFVSVAWSNDFNFLKTDEREPNCNQF